MKKPTFLEGVAVALIASLTGSILFTALTPILASGMALRLVITGLAFGYVIYLLRRSPERLGRITALTVWIVAAIAIWWLYSALTIFVLMHLGLIWLIRSLYFYSGVLPGLVDLGLNGLSLAAAVWAATWTGSLFLSLWCGFLAQALFCAIPRDITRRSGEARNDGDTDDQFEHAYRAAESAVRKLSSIR